MRKCVLIKTFPIVCDGYFHDFLNDLQPDRYFRTASMLYCIVDRFLQKGSKAAPKLKLDIEQFNALFRTLAFCMGIDPYENMK